MYAITGQNWRDFVGRKQISFLLSDFHIPGGGLSELIFSGSGNLASFTFEDGRVYDPESRYIGSYNYNTPFALSGNIDESEYQYYYNKDSTNEAIAFPWSKNLGANYTRKISWPIQRIFLNAYESGSTRLGNANVASVNSGTLQIGFNPPASYSYHFPSGTQSDEGDSPPLPYWDAQFETRGYFTGYLRNDDEPESFITIRNVSVVGGSDSGKFVVSSFEEGPITGGASGEIVIRHIDDSVGLHVLQLGVSTNTHEMINGEIGRDVIDLQSLWGKEGPIWRNLTLIREYDYDEFGITAPESGWLWGGPNATGVWPQPNTLADPEDNSKVDRYLCYSVVMDKESSDMLDRPLSVLLEYYSGEVGQFEIITGISHTHGSGYITSAITGLSSGPVVAAVGGYNASDIITEAESIIEIDTEAFDEGRYWYSVIAVDVSANNTTYPSGVPDVHFIENPSDTIYPATKIKAAGTAYLGTGESDLNQVTGVQMISGGTYEYIPTVEFSGIYPSGDGALAQVAANGGGHAGIGGGGWMTGKILSNISINQNGIYFSGNNVLDYGLAKSSYGVSHSLPEVFIGEGGGGVSGVRDSGHFLFSGYQKTFTGQFNLWTGVRSGEVLSAGGFHVPPNSGPSAGEIAGEYSYPPLINHRWYAYDVDLGLMEDPWQPPYNVGYLRSGISYQNQEPTGWPASSGWSGYIVIPDSAPDDSMHTVNVQFKNNYDSLPLVARLVAVGSEDGATRSGILYETGQVQSYHYAREYILTGVPSGGTQIW